MIIDFSFENFKSFKGVQHFSMEASASHVKEGNIFEVDVKGIGKLRLLKSAAVFGANASGKTNLLEAIAALFGFVTTSAGNQVNTRISNTFYNPFRLDTETASLPTSFKINFVGPENLKYTLEIRFDRNGILVEKLDFYPFGRPANLYERIVSEDGTHDVQLGKSLKGKRIDRGIFPNQLFLSKFGSTKHEQLSPVFTYFSAGRYIHANDTLEAANQILVTAQRIAHSDDPKLMEGINQLVASADTHINGFKIKEAKFSDFKLPDFMPEEDQLELFERIKFRVSTQHNRYKNGELVDTIELDLMRDESHGTKILFSVGGSILEQLKMGGLMLIDELDSGLHPDLVARLVDFFLDSDINVANAQFLFTTHATSVIEKSRMRSDQIWMAEKNPHGESELFSVQDFEDVRADIPFDKWYRAGKFGAIPSFSPFPKTDSGAS